MHAPPPRRQINTVRRHNENPLAASRDDGSLSTAVKLPRNSRKHRVRQRARHFHARTCNRRLIMHCRLKGLQTAPARRISITVGPINDVLLPCWCPLVNGPSLVHRLSIKENKINTRSSPFLSPSHSVAESCHGKGSQSQPKKRSLIQCNLRRNDACIRQQLNFTSFDNLLFTNLWQKNKQTV